MYGLEPLIRVGVLGTIITLLERNSEFREKEEAPFGQENEDRLYEIPIKMLNDYNQQVNIIIHVHVWICLVMNYGQGWTQWTIHVHESN